jgi:hypothetical protein
LAEPPTGIVLEVTQRSAEIKGFASVRKHGVMGRSFGWMGGYRRTRKGHERYCMNEENVIEGVMFAIG